MLTRESGQNKGANLKEDKRIYLKSEATILTAEEGKSQGNVSTAKNTLETRFYALV